MERGNFSDYGFHVKYPHNQTIRQEQPEIKVHDTK